MYLKFGENFQPRGASLILMTLVSTKPVEGALSNVDDNFFLRGQKANCQSVVKISE